MKTVLLFIILFSLNFLSFSQEKNDSIYAENPNFTQYKEKSKFSQNLYLGGGLGFTFGDVTIVDVSPIIGYRISDRFSCGVGFQYSYLNSTFYDVEISVYAVSIFGKFLINDNIFIQAESSQVNYTPYYQYSNEDRIWSSPLYIGGGYREQIGGNSYVEIAVLYDVLEELPSYIQSNPMFRVGFSIGL